MISRGDILSSHKVLKGDMKGIEASSFLELRKESGEVFYLSQGAMEIQIEKKSTFGSLFFTPQFKITQNGESFSITIPSKFYNGEELFTLPRKESGLNYDLYLRTNEKITGNREENKIERCTYQEFGYSCNIGPNGWRICADGLVERRGFQEVKNKYLEKTQIYTLTFGVDASFKAAFVSENKILEKKSSELLSVCK